MSFRPHRGPLYSGGGGATLEALVALMAAAAAALSALAALAAGQQSTRSSADTEPKASTKSAKERSHGSWAVGGLVFAVVGPVFYIALRLYSLARAGHVDPRLVVSANHLGFIWRSAIAGWFACVCAVIAAIVVARSTNEPAGRTKLPHRLAWSSVIAAVVLTALALKFP